MGRWIFVFLYVYMKSHLFFQDSQEKKGSFRMSMRTNGKAQEFINYPECVEDSNGTALTGVKKRDNDNSASNCASYCKGMRNTFSGTKNNLCICGNEIRIGIKISKRCETECPGNRDEICGGEDAVSLRRTGYEKITTVVPRSTKLETSSEVNVSPKTGTTASSAKESHMTTLSITIPVVVLVAGSVVLIVYLVLRHKKQMRKGNQKRSVSHTSDCDSYSQRNEILVNHNYWILSAEDTAQTTQADDRCKTDYNEYSIVLDLSGALGDNKDYDKINGKQTTSTRDIYSHLPGTNITDNTYSHIGPAYRTKMCKTDNTYNTIQFSQLSENTSARSHTNNDKNVVYDRAKTRDKRQLDVMNEYAHLNSTSFHK